MRFFMPRLASLVIGIGLPLMSSASLVHAQANMAAEPTKPAHKLAFSNLADIDPMLTLPRPPAPASEMGLSELETVRENVKAATPSRLKRAADDDANESVALFTETIPGLDLGKLPATAKLFHDVENDLEIVTKTAKKGFARKRPFELDATIATCVPARPTPAGKTPSSYPSGHGTYGFADGIILAHLIPEKADVILARSQDYGVSRVVCGVHFPSDIVASQAWASALTTAMLDNADFQKEFASARNELVAAGLTR